MLVPNELDLNRKIRGYVKLALGMPVITSNVNFPAPTGSYATALQISDLRQGFSFGDNTYNQTTDKTTVSVSSNRIITFSIQIYRDANVLGLARLLSFYGATPAGEYYLAKNGLTLIDWSNIRDLTTLVDAEMEPRASIDLTFGQVVTYSQETDRIVEIDIASSYQDSKIINDNNHIGE